MTKKVYYFPELDTLRFLAFLMVLVHHGEFVKTIVPWRTLSNFGWMGVDLFLCLSAFLFTRLLYIEYQSKGGINIKNFYIRRGFRIWPLYYVFLGITLTLTISNSGWHASTSQRAFGMLVFADNIISAVQGYNLQIMFAAHMWTISYEEQFYLVIPWVLRKFYQVNRRTSLIVLACVLLVGMSTRAFFIFKAIDHPAIWVLPITHFESILGGIIIGLGLFDQQLKRMPPWLWLTVGVLALGQVTRLANIPTISWELMITYPLVSLGMSLIIYAVMQNNLGWFSVFFRNRITGYLGKISYGLYVYHLAGLYYGYQITNTFVSPDRLLAYPVIGLAVGLLVTIVISMLSYHILEKPFLRIKGRFADVESRPI